MKFIKQIQNLQRNFLWGGPSKENKWPLVAWNTLCQPKSQGGLGLKDPQVFSSTLAAKLWWRWIKTPSALWARIWRNKYAPNIPIQSLIRAEGIRPGSLIWNNAWRNHDLVQSQCFWEVHNGTSTLFWDDTWEQHTILGEEEKYLDLCFTLERAGWVKLHHYWTTFQPSGNSTLRTWKPLEEWPVQWNEQLKDLVSKIIQERQVETKDGEDIIRWGRQGDGEFQVKTSYQSMQDSGNTHNRTIWGKFGPTLTGPKSQLFYGW
jgi:hypothetical protein